MLPTGQRTRYAYDGAGRVTQVQYGDGSQETYAYRPDGALMLASNDTIAVTFVRDKEGRTLQEQQGSHNVTSTYDGHGRRVGLASCLGAAIRYTREAQGHVTQLQSGNWQALFERDAQGLEIQRTLSGGVSTRSRRDPLGRLSEQLISVGLGGRQAARTRTYTWQSSGRLSQIQDTQFGLTHFEHDAVGNLAATTFDDGTRELRLSDAVGNLFTTTEQRDRRYGSAGQLLEAQGTRFTYDMLGNLTSKTTAQGQQWNYAWDAAGYLAEVVCPDGEAVRFAYDALGRRVSKSYQGKVTRWVWDGDKFLHEWQESTTEAALGSVAEVVTWLFEDDSLAPLAKLTAQGSYSVVADHLGTPLALYDAQGQQTWQVQLNSYGAVRIDTSQAPDCPFRYQGQYEDVETGLYYNRFRYYDAETGQYISQDPIRLEGGWKMYGYVHDTSTWIDVSGLNGVPGLEWVDPKTLNFSQGYVNSQVHEYEKLMRTGEWNWNRSPLQVAEVNGKLVSLDNRRLLAAQRAGVESVPMNKVNLSDPRPEGGTYGSNLNKKLNSRPKNRPDLPKVKLPAEGTPIQPTIVCPKT
ncbi:MAG: RHS repeat protein [Hymenobacter sp.]|nr:MAG: RHS repeat protein [Hymenobacter sp.]